MRLPKYRVWAGVTFLILCIALEITLLFLVDRWHPWRGFLTYICFALPVVWSVYGGRPAPEPPKAPPDLDPVVLPDLHEQGAMNLYKRIPKRPTPLMKSMILEQPVLRKPSLLPPGFVDAYVEEDAPHGEEGYKQQEPWP